MNVDIHALEIVDLEELVFGDECKCEGLHPCYECSGEVTHIGSTCYGNHVERLVCLNTASYTYKALAEGAWCAECRLPASECWTIRPI